MENKIKFLIMANVDKMEQEIIAGYIHTSWHIPAILL